MINPTYPGVYVQERSSGARAVAGVSTSTTAFVGMTQRGLLNKPTRIFNFREYDRNFGTNTGSGEMAKQVQLYFDNGGGEAWITRIADGAVAATLTLKSETQDDVLELTAKEQGADGNNLRVEIDYNTVNPEATFNMRIFRRIANLDGSVDIRDVETFSNLSMNSALPSSVVTVINNQSKLLTAAYPAGLKKSLDMSYSLSGLFFESPADPAIVSRFSSIPNGQFTLNIDGYPSSQVIVAKSVDEASFIFNITQGIVDALTALSLTNANVVCSFNDSTTSPTEPRNFKITVEDLNISISPSTNAATDIAIPFMLGAAQGGLEVGLYANLRPAPNGYTSKPYSVSANKVKFSRILRFANIVKSDLDEFKLTDSSGSGDHTGPIAYPTPGEMRIGNQFSPVTLETTGALVNVVENMDTIASAIANNSNQMWDAEIHGYRIVMTPKFGNSNTGISADFKADSGTGYNLSAGSARMFSKQTRNPKNVASYSLGQTGLAAKIGDFQDSATSGSNGNAPLVANYRAAFDIIEREVDLFNLMVLPRAADATGTQSDADRKTAFNAASAFCAKERAFLLVDPPSDAGPNQWVDASTAATGVDALRIGLETRNSAVFWPRLKKADGSFQDPAGPMAGLMARTDSSRGVWKAAAGVEATMRGVSGVEYMMSDLDNGVINPKAVNALRIFPDGILSWGARTLIGFNSSGNIDDKYIPVRRTMLFIEESLYRGLRFAVFEPNDEPLWAQIRLAAGSFMNTLFRQGAFAGSKAEDAYYVICDETTTTETDKNLGIVNIVVAFAPLKPAEFVILTVTQIAGQTPT